MAIIGLSIPVCGIYKNNDGVITYSDPFIASKAIEYSVTISSSEGSPLYADDTIAENDKGEFQSGELEVSTTDMDQEISEKILGLKKVEITLPNSKKVTELVRDDDIQTPYLGFGIIERHRINGVDSYRAIFLPKIFFSIPEEAATTKGESIEWQTKKIKATIMRSEELNENYKQPWMIDSFFASQAEAKEYLLYKCGKTTAEVKSSSK